MFWAADDQDRLESYAGASYTHTANGERRTKTTAAGTTTYDYDVFGNQWFWTPTLQLTPS